MINKVLNIWHSGDPNSGGHRDLWVESPCMGLKECFDSYWLLSDLTIPTPEDKPKGLIGNIKIKLPFIIKKLIQLVEELKKDQIAYFPIGLFDEYSSCFRLKLISNHSIEISFGTTKIEGYNIGFADVASYNADSKGFNLTHDPYTFDKNKLIENLRGSIDKIVNMRIAESTSRRSCPPKGVTFIYKKED